MTSELTASAVLDGIHVTRRGHGEPVLMIHGGGQGTSAGGAQQWERQRPLSEQGWELILPDRPGSGQSPTRGPEDFEVDAVWAAELLGDGAHLVGHSYGGAIALCAAGRRPEAVRSLTLIEPPVLSVSMGDPAAREMALAVKSASEARIPLVGMIKAFRLLGIPRGLTPRPPLSQLRTMGKGFQTMRHPYEWDAAPTIDAVADAKVPALLVTGNWSPALDANADEIAGRLAGTRLSIDAGHHFPHMIDDGAQFNEALQNFMAQART